MPFLFLFYLAGSGGLLERMASCSPDIISLDQSVDFTDGVKRCGTNFAFQVRATLCVCTDLSAGVADC